jgi:hypothetical protein
MDDPAAVREQYATEQNLLSKVERTEANVVAVVDEHAVLEGYRRSLLYETRPLPDDLELPFRVHGRTTIFVATK